MRTLTIKIFALLFLVLLSVESFSQLDTEHYFSPLHASSGGGGGGGGIGIPIPIGGGDGGDQFLYLATPSTVPFDVNITDGAGNVLATATISNTTPFEYPVGNGQTTTTEMFVTKDELNTALPGRGLIMTGPLPFTATFKTSMALHAEMMTSKGKAAKGRTFRAGGVPVRTTGDDKGFVTSFMATEPGTTTINVSGYDPNVEFDGATVVTDDNLTITLQQGESYVLSGLSTVAANTDGFIGALITSDKDIIVEHGAVLGNVAVDATGQDVYFDQSAPIERLGTDYIVIQGGGPAEMELPVITAHSDNTQIFVNGGAAPIATINAGEHFIVPNANYQNGNMFIETSEPAYLYQALSGSDLTNGGMMFIPPFNCYLPRLINIPKADGIGGNGYTATAMVFTEQGSQVTYNGAVQTGGALVAGTSWESYKFEIAGDVELRSTGAMSASLFGVSGAASYAGAYAGFSSIPDESLITYADTCFQSNTTFSSIHNVDSTITSFEWDFGDPASGANNVSTLEFPTHIFSASGTYTVQLVIHRTTCNDTVLQPLTILEPLTGGTVDAGPDISTCVTAGTAQLGAAPTVGYSYSWLPITGLSDPNIANPTVDLTVAGSTTYTVTQSDNQPCPIVAEDEVIVDVFSIPTSSITGATSLCLNAASPDVTLTGTGGTGPYDIEYTINNGPVQTVTTAAGATVSSLIAATTGVANTFTYDLVSVTDANTCSQAQTGSVDVIIKDISGTVTGTANIPQNDPSPLVTFTGSGGAPIYIFNYTINSGPVLSVTGDGSGVATVPQATSVVGDFVYELVSVSDENGAGLTCDAVDVATITITDYPFANIASDITVCENATEPTITFTGGGSTGPYTINYTLDGAAQPAITTGGGDVFTITAPTTPVGTYTYVLVDVSDADTTVLMNGTAVVTVTNLPTATISGDASRCLNDPIPNVIFAGSDGAGGPYTIEYTINNGPIQTVVTDGAGNASVAAQTGIGGEYTYDLVSVADANCSQAAVGSTVITVDPLNGALSGGTSVCLNTASPDVIFTGNNGVAPFIFTYQVDGGVDQTVTSDGTGVAAVPAPTDALNDIVYTISNISDNAGSSCASTSTVTITRTAPPTATITQDATACLNAPEPTITFTGTGTTAPYTFTFNIDGGLDQTVTSDGTGVATITAATNAAGTFAYNVSHISDGFSCQQDQVGSVDITVLPLGGTVTGGTAVCKDVPSPNITLTGSGGTAPYTFIYTVDGGANTTVTSDGTGIVTIPAPTDQAGSFSYDLVSVEDNTSLVCASISSQVVDVNGLPTATVTGGTAVCTGDASPDVTFTGALANVAPFTFRYQINGGAVQTAGPSTGASITVPAPTNIVGPFVYTIVDVQDNAGCVNTSASTTTMAINPLPSAIIATQSPLICEGVANNIIFTGSNGTAPYTFTYTENGGAQAPISTTGGSSTRNEPSLNSVGIHSYALVSVRDVNGCLQAVTNTTAVEATTVNATIDGGGAVCEGTAVGPSITFTGADGALPYTYQYTINGGSVQTAIGSGIATSPATITASTATDGNFRYELVGVTDFRGCPKNVSGTGEERVVVINPNPSGVMSVDPTVCKDNLAEITFTPTASPSNYTFYYREIPEGEAAVLNTKSGTDLTESILTDKGGTTVTFIFDSIVDNGSGCSTLGGDTQNLIIYPTPTGNLSIDSSYCVDDEPKDLLLTAEGGTAPYSVTYKIYENLLDSTPTLSMPDFNDSIGVPVSTGKEGVFVYKFVGLLDSNGCEAYPVPTDTVEITVNSIPTADFSVDPDRTTILEPRIEIINTSTVSKNANINPNYKWDFGDGIEFVGEEVYEHSYEDTGTYEIILVVTEGVCTSITSQTVIVEIPLLIYIPQAFTPNGDGINDTFSPKGDGFDDYSMRIYDRWGNMIFFTDDINKGWDGAVNGGSEMAQIDAYIYVVDVIDTKSQHSYTYRGALSMMK